MLAVLAVGAGVWAMRAGERRIGWGAVVAGVLGAIGAVAATRSGVGNLDRVVVWSALFAATLRFATPLIFAAIGGLFSERSGVVNIGLEGMMLMGAFFAALGADASRLVADRPAIAGVVAGGALALVHALFTVTLRADQIVSGVALNFLALGLTSYLYVDVFGIEGTPDDLPAGARPDLAADRRTSRSSATCSATRNLLVWLALLLVAVTAVVLFRTPAGLRLRSAGENPLAAATAGLSVARIRYRAVLLSGVLAAAGGAYISIGFVHSFGENMTHGRGYIALAVLICGRWRPLDLLAVALLFGFCSALAQRLPVFSESGAVLFQALPYVLTLIVVAGVVGRSIPPAALGRPLARN